MSPPNHLSGAVAGEDTPENFAEFFESFLAQQASDLRSLRSAVSSGAGELRSIVDLVVGHYERYYAVKSAAASADVLPMFTPSWTSTTENLFLWVGGWRPTTAFHLFYSKSGIQLENELDSILDGESPGDIGDISPEQLGSIDELHRRIVSKEKKISEEEAAAQEKVADGQMIELSELMASNGGEGMEEMEEAMVPKRAGIEKVLKKADELRLETLKGVVEILNPLQAAQFLIAAAELHLTVHNFGVRRDADHGGPHPGAPGEVESG